MIAGKKTLAIIITLAAQPNDAMFASPERLARRSADVGASSAQKLGSER
jgi:hypothetical protein